MSVNQTKADHHWAIYRWLHTATWVYKTASSRTSVRADIESIKIAPVHNFPYSKRFIGSRYWIAVQTSSQTKFLATFKLINHSRCCIERVVILHIIPSFYTSWFGTLSRTSAFLNIRMPLGQNGKFIDPSGKYHSDQALQVVYGE